MCPYSPLLKMFKSQEGGSTDEGRFFFFSGFTAEGDEEKSQGLTLFFIRDLYSTRVSWSNNCAGKVWKGEGM